MTTSKFCKLQKDWDLTTKALYNAARRVPYFSRRMLFYQVFEFHVTTEAIEFKYLGNKVFYEKQTILREK
jgi:hypothetical protein